MTSRKVLFLDIDGVLNSTRTAAAWGYYPLGFDNMQAFDGTALQLVRQLCTKGGVQVVLSSSWRLFFTAKQVADGLNLPVVDTTPCFLHDVRGTEIAAWLSENPDVTHYVIVDDSADMLKSQQDAFVQTNPDNGLSWENIMAICRRLDLDAEHIYGTAWKFNVPSNT